MARRRRGLGTALGFVFDCILYKREAEDTTAPGAQVQQWGGPEDFDTTLFTGRLRLPGIGAWKNSRVRRRTGGP